MMQAQSGPATRALVFAACLLGAAPRAAPAAPAPRPDPGAARIASIQKQVETRRGGQQSWSPSIADQALFALDRVRTGPASRAAILYSDQTLHRLNERSEIEIQPPSAGSPGLLRVLSGDHYFSSRAPKDYGRIETPTVTAAIRGTEFTIHVDEDRTTTITMIEGVVEATNPQGTLMVGRGEQAYVEPGKAPVKRIVVHPLDAVSWAFDYPPVLGGSDATRLQASGDGELARAAELLSAGQVGQAEPLIEAARARNPKDPLALALESVVLLTANRKEEAMHLAEQAHEADPRSPAAALAVSFAAQAAFDIARARDLAEQAARLDPESALALARVAEMRMAEGDLDGAREAAEGAVRRAPDQSRALMVLGFVALAQFDTAAAETHFEKAVAADPGSPLARLGLGIVRIRTRRLSDGREQIQTAVALDPHDAVLRSYLAKALYEEKRSEAAGKELDTAKELDPLDPTPYLYDAIRKQNENRPVEALADLRRSMERNERRAVYRSSLLLDQDRAVRSSDLARVYNDLGFDQLGILTARRTSDDNQANYSSHLFMSGGYRNVPTYAPAFLSEILQARLYQPTSVNAARPDVVNETVSFNEYTALFDRPRARGFGSLTYGRTDTGLEELIVNNPAFLELISRDQSEIRSGEAIGTLNGDRFAAAVSYRRVSDDGFRFNSDVTFSNYRAFVQVSPTWRDSFQINALYGRQDTGDLPLRFFATRFAPERFESDLRNIGLGYHRTLSPASDVILSAIWNRTEQTRESLDPLAPGTSTAVLDGPQLEIQDVLRTSWATWVAGVGAFRGEVRLEAPSGASLKGDDEFTSGYVYATLRRMGPLEATLGAAVERVRAPVGLLTPRDSQIGAAELSFEETRVSPKLGFSLDFPTRTTIRGAAYSRLSPAIGRIQTVEPTQVQGFNQFFREPGGTRSRSYGIGIDQDLGTRFFAGASLLRRHLDIPEAFCDAPTQFSGCAQETADFLVQRESRDWLGSAYLNATLGNRIAVALETSWDDRQFDFTVVNNNGFFVDRIETLRLRPKVRGFLPWGLFAGAAATRIDQKVDQFDDLNSDSREVVRSRFWVGDVQLGYRLPRRLGSILLEARNVSDREFEAFERAVEDTVIPARTVLLTVNVTY